MIDFKYTDDLVVEHGDIATVDEPEAGAQRIKDRLLTFLGEWFLDLSFGPAYRDNILVKNPRLDVVNAIIKDEILKSQDGTFNSFEASLDSSRHLTVTYELDTTSGIISGTVTI